MTSRRPTREFLLFMAFVALTSAMTWPWVIHLRNACADPGDPYLHSWVMWWDYYQTFHDPIHLFNGNIFYPLRYTLAFSESEYGTAMLFFPLYALGFRPLTVNSVATFLGFAFCGYGAFRLSRTLTGSTKGAWISGIIFAFTPYRLQVLSQITYVFAGWIPLLLEALVLFARGRSWRRTIWLAVAFTMNALSSLTWMSLSLVPLAASALALVIIHRLWRDRQFWVRGAMAAVASLLILFPFLLPYLRVSKLYGFSWGPELVTRNSPTVWNWLVADYRLRLWNGLGESLGIKGARMFPGIIAPALAALSVFVIPINRAGAIPIRERGRRVIARLIPALDVIAVGATLSVIGALTLAYSENWKFLGRVFAGPTLWRSVAVLLAALIIRIMIVYPTPLRRLLEMGGHILALGRSEYREALWLGWIWTIVGFLLSLGMNSVLFRVLFNSLFIFRSMREPSRAAMIACVGLSLLGGLGALRLIEAASRWRIPAVALIAILVMVDVHPTPMQLTYGAADPDQLATWLRTRPMRGGLVELPTGGGILPHLYMLRAADHGKPLVNAISTFVPNYVYEIEDRSRETPIPVSLLDTLERVPTSYLVIHNDLIDTVKLPVVELFLAHGIAANRLRFIRRLGAADVYAVVKVEPDAQPEQPGGPAISLHDWSTALNQSPDGLAGPYLNWSQSLYRVYLVATGTLPRYEDFLAEAKRTGNALVGGDDDLFAERRLQLASRLAREKLGGVSDAEFVDRLISNAAGINVDSNEREGLKARVTEKSETRAHLLSALADDPRVIAREKERSLVLIHYFAYLRRNPADPPDKDMSGFEFWVGEVRKHGDLDLATAFSRSIERNNQK
jgi:hypothetical protein